MDDVIQAVGLEKHCETGPSLVRAPDGVTLIGLVGVLSGVLLGWNVARIISFAANLCIRSRGGSPGNVSSSPGWAVLGDVALSLLTSPVAGGIPACRTARLDPIPPCTTADFGDGPCIPGTRWFCRARQQAGSGVAQPVPETTGRWVRRPSHRG